MLATEPDRPGEVDLRSYVDVLRRRWRTIAVTTAVITVLLVGAALRQDKQYRAEADLLIEQTSIDNVVSGDPNSALVAAATADRRLNNEVGALNSGTTRAAVAAAYGGDLDPDDVSAKVAMIASDTVTVGITATDPAEAAKLVNLYVQTFIELRRQQRIDELLAAGAEVDRQIEDLTARIATVRQPITEVESQLADNPRNPALIARRDDLTQQLATQITPLESQRSFYQQSLEDLRVSAGIAQSGGARILTMAEQPTDPVAPNPVRSGVLGIVVGLVLGVGIAFVRDNLDERIRNLADAERVAGGLPSLALVPEVEGAPATSFVAIRDAPSSPAAEAFRSLRTSVKFASFGQRLNVLQVTSAVLGEGKSTVAANLAVAFAQAGERVALVCCDLRRPSIHLRFDQTVLPGLTDVILGDIPLSGAVREVSPGLFVVPSGSLPPNPSELLSSERAAAVVRALSESVDLVVLDCTPVLPVADALVVSRLCDATLMVVDTRSTMRKVLQRGLQHLEQVSAPLIGLVLNGVDLAGNEGYGYGPGYGGSGYGSDYPAGSDHDQNAPGTDPAPPPGARRSARSARV